MFVLTYLLVGGPLDGTDIEVDFNDREVWPFGYVYRLNPDTKEFEYIEDLRRN